MADRLEMAAEIAVAGHPAFEVSEVEARRPGPHYSVETLEAILAERPGDQLFFLIGADSLVDLPHWRQPGRIGALATIVVANRPGVPRPDGDALVAALGPEARPILDVTIPPIPASPRTKLRRRVAEGAAPDPVSRVPRGVEAYIEANGLYRGA